MARLVGEIPIAPYAVTGGTSYQILQIVAPAHQKVLISGFYLGNNYNTNGTPGLLSFAFAGTGGSGGTSVTPVSVKQDDTETFQSGCQVGLSTLATSLSIFRYMYINPQISPAEYLPLFDEISLKGGGIFVATFTPQITGNTSGWFRIVE
jgi:hypothetical protein